MARRVQVNGQWVDAPDAPILPPAPQQVATASPPPSVPQPAGVASLENASAVLRDMRGSFGTTPRIAQDAPLSVDASGLAAPGSSLGTATDAVAGGGAKWRSQEDLDLARRRAFLDGKDSMAGMKAVRGLLAEEVANRGGDVSAGGSIPSVSFLEGQLAKLGPAKGIKTNEKGEWTVGNDKAGEDATLQAMGFGGPAKGIQIDSQGNWTVGNDSAGEAATLQAMAFGDSAAAGGNRMAGGPDAIAAKAFNPETPQLAPSGNLPQAAVNEWMQTALRGKVSAGQQPLDQVATWQVTPQPIPGLRQDPGRDAALAAFAARREAAPTSPGEALLAVGAGNAYGTRAGQFKPGNTMNLGFFDPRQLKPLNSDGHYSGYNPGNFQALF